MINVSNTYLDCLEQTDLLLVIPFSTKHYVVDHFLFQSNCSETVGDAWEGAKFRCPRHFHALQLLSLSVAVTTAAAKGLTSVMEALVAAASTVATAHLNQIL